MDQCSDVDEFHDHGEIDVSGIDFSGGAAGKQSQQRPKTFTPGCRLRRRRNLRLPDRMPMVCSCNARLDLLDGAVELVLQLHPNEARVALFAFGTARRRLVLRVRAGRRVPRGEDNGWSD